MQRRTLKKQNCLVILLKRNFLTLITIKIWNYGMLNFMCHVIHARIAYFMHCSCTIFVMVKRQKQMRKNIFADQE